LDVRKAHYSSWMQVTTSALSWQRWELWCIKGMIYMILLLTSVCVSDMGIEVTKVNYLLYKVQLVCLQYEIG